MNDALSATYLDALEAEMRERWVDGKGIADGNRILDLIRRVREAESALEFAAKDSARLNAALDTAVRFNGSKNRIIEALEERVRTAEGALGEVYHAYVEEFGPDGFAEPDWPDYRFHIAIEDARILSGNPKPVVKDDDNGA